MNVSLDVALTMYAGNKPIMHGRRTHWWMDVKRHRNIYQYFSFVQ